VRADLVRFGDIVQMSRTPLDIDLARDYRRIGIFSWGKGMIHRDPGAGTEMGKMRYFTFPIPSLIFSNIQAWEGAVALASDAEGGFICSSRFYPYLAKNDAAVSLRYLYEFFRSAPGLEIMRAASPGTQVRNKVLSKAALEDAVVPLPDRATQDRIAAHLDSLARASTPRVASPDGLLQRDWLGETVPVGDLVTLVTRSEAVAPDATYDLSGVKWYGQGLFVRETKSGRELSASTVRRVEPGDLVYNRLFAWKQSFALATEPGWVSNEFPTFRIDADRVTPRVLLAALLSPSFTAAVNDASTGSTPTSRNRLKENDFLRLEVTIPRRADQPAIERALKIADRARTLAERAQELASAILPAARNEVFGALQQ